MAKRKQTKKIHHSKPHNFDRTPRLVKPISITENITNVIRTVSDKVAELKEQS